MSPSTRIVLASVIALSVSPAFAHSKVDAGSGPTQGAKPSADSTAENTSNGSMDNSARDQSRPEARSR